MEPKSDFDQIRDDIEARQRNILQEDVGENGWRISASLWGSNAKSRPSSILFAVLSLFLAIGILAILFKGNLRSNGIAAFLVSAGLLFLSFKLFSQSLASRKSKGKGE